MAIACRSIFSRWSVSPSSGPTGALSAHLTAAQSYGLAPATRGLLPAAGTQQVQELGEGGGQRRAGGGRAGGRTMRLVWYGQWQGRGWGFLRRAGNELAVERAPCRGWELQPAAGSLQGAPTARETAPLRLRRAERQQETNVALALGRKGGVQCAAGAYHRGLVLDCGHTQFGLCVLCCCEEHAESLLIELEAERCSLDSLGAFTDER